MRYYQSFPTVIPQIWADCSRVTHPSATKQLDPLSENSVTSAPFDLHVLSTPPAFILSQDQTLNKMVSEELPLLRSSYRSYPLASKKSLRAFQVTRLERTSVLFWCFVFFITLFNLQGAHRFSSGSSIIPFGKSFVKYFFQNFFSPYSFS